MNFSLQPGRSQLLAREAGAPKTPVTIRMATMNAIKRGLMAEKKGGSRNSLKVTGSYWWGTGARPAGNEFSTVHISYLIFVSTRVRFGWIPIIEQFHTNQDNQAFAKLT